MRGSTRGLAVGCGINPRYGKLDPYAMAACVIDEAIRNCVAVGADPERIALLDNFCWGNTERPETLGSLVLAAQACHDMALAYGTPFISGKDSLNNEYTHEGRSLAIPPTLLISAIGQVPDVRRCVTMDLKEPGNLLLLAGHDPARAGRVALGRAHEQQGGGRVPRVDPALGRRSVRGPARGDRPRPGAELSRSERRGTGRRAGRDGDGRRPGRRGELWRDVPRDDDAARDLVLLFSESPTRFLLEVRPECLDELSGIFSRICRWAGSVR